MDDFTRFVFDTVSDAFVIANQNSHVEFISSSFACLLGFSKIALTKSTIKNIFEGTKFSALVSECLETQQVLKDKRLRLSLQFRSPIDVFASLHPYKPENTTIGKALVIFRKCTVEESERLRWMELAEEECRIFGGIFEWDEEKDDVRHRFLHTASYKRIKEILQVSSDVDQEFFRQYWIQGLRLPKEDIRKIMKPFKQLIGSEKVYSYDSTQFSFCSTDFNTGKSRYIGNSEDGKPLFYVWAYQAEKDLKQFSIERDVQGILKSCFENSPNLTMIIEPNENLTDANILLANEKLCKTVGKLEEEIVGRSILSVLGPDLSATWLNWTVATNTEGKPCRFDLDYDGVFTEAVVIQNGRNNYICMANNSIKECSDESLELVVKKRTTQLEEAMAVRSRYLAFMSHELRTPLAGVMGCFSILADYDLPADCKDIIRTAMIGGEQLMTIINDILEVSKLEENKVQLEELPFSLPKLIEDSLEVVCFDCEKKNLELISDLDPDIQDPVVGDARRLKQILVNLLSNAVKFSTKGEIVVSARSTDLIDGYCSVEISIKDEGIGISDESLSVLFQPFMQGDQTVTRKYGGTGLGLSICKKLSELMGGTIKVKSKVGEGSTFTTTITLKKRNGVYKPINWDSSSLDTKNILFIDHSITRQKIVGSILSRWGVQCRFLSSLKDFPESSSMTSPDSLIVIVESKFGLEGITGLMQIYRSISILSYSRPKEHFQSASWLRYVDRVSFIYSSKPLRIDALFAKIFGKPPVSSQEEVSTIGREFSMKFPNVDQEVQVDFSWIRILVAEDNEINRKLVHRILISIGIKEENIVVVLDGVQAFEAVKSYHFDLVLMDMLMPNMGGLECTTLIRKTLPSNKQPVIFALTANAFEEDRVKCLEAGMSEVITKPINRALLREKIAILAQNLQTDEMC